MKSGYFRTIVLLAMVIIGLIAVTQFHWGEWVIRLRDWIESLGEWGVIVFILLYVVGVVAVLPGSALTFVAGTLFGPILGIALVSIGATIGAGIAFLIARYFARDAVTRFFSDSEKFKKIDELTATHGDIIVALTRLVPILPFNLLNYGFGLTRVSFGTYMFWSWVCMLPATAFYVLGADVVTNAVSGGEISWVVVGALAGFGIVLLLLVRFARSKLNLDKSKGKS